MSVRSLINQESVNKVCQVWPGIELDILEEERKAHLIVIVNPKYADTFQKKVNAVIGTSITLLSKTY